MKAIIIARVSTEEQKEANNSLPAQLFRLEKYCQSKGFEILEPFSFDESAYKNQRNDFDSILDFVLNQKEKVAVCFDKVDRLSRNIFDKRVSTLYEKALKDEVELHFVSDGQVINSQLSAVEKFNFSISLGLAKYYSDAISDNVKRAFEQKLRKGEWIGRPPYGYKNITLPNDKKDIVVDEFESKVVEKAFQLYSTEAYSMELLRKKIKDDYGVNWSKGFVDKTLKEPFYYGKMQCKGVLYSHRYPALISKLLFDQVQNIKTGFNKKRFKFAGLPYYYRGLIRCEDCGCSITPEKHKGHVYYHCTQYNGKHGAGWIREDEITKQLGKVFEGLKLPDFVYNEINECLKDNHACKMEFRDQKYNQLTKEHELYTKRLENLQMDRFDRRITDSEYDRYYQSFRDKIAEIDASIGMIQNAEDNYYETANTLLEITKQAYDKFASSEIEKRRQLVKLVLSNLTLKNKTIRYEAREPFNMILKFNHSQSWLRGQGSNLQPSR